MLEDKNLLFSVQHCERVGNLSGRTWTPHEELAFAIVELAIDDYKLGVSSLLNAFGRCSTKKIVRELTKLASDEGFLKFYKRIARKGQPENGIKKYLHHLILKEVKNIVGDAEAKKHIGILRNLYNMMTAMVFFKERRWCEDLVDIDGTKILKTLEISQKLQAA